MRLGRRRLSGGFTVMEMITVIFIIGLILSLLGFEFVSVIDKTMHTRANTDAESQARIIMSKVETHMRTAYFDYVDYNGPTASPNPVISPLPGSAATDFVIFYRVHAGALATTPPTACPAGPLVGAPCPPFDQVTIQFSPNTPGELDEDITEVSTGNVEPPIVLGTNVSSFQVTGISPSQYQLTLTVSQPSGHCVNNQCSFTLSDVVYVGGQE